MWLPLLATVPVLAALELRAEHRQGREQIYLLKPLTTLTIILVAATAPAPQPGGYQVAIIAGLFASLAGDVFLMLPRDRFLAGLASFLVAHVCYIAAFVGSAGAPRSIVAAGVLAGYAAVLMQRLWLHLGRYRWPVVIYSALLLVMVAAAYQYASGGAVNGWAALAGAVLFLISDSLLALDRFETRDRRRQLPVLGSYFAAQTLIAISVTTLGR